MRLSCFGSLLAKPTDEIWPSAPPPVWRFGNRKQEFEPVEPTKPCSGVTEPKMGGFRRSKHQQIRPKHPISPQTPQSLPKTTLFRFKFSDLIFKIFLKYTKTMPRQPEPADVFTAIAAPVRRAILLQLSRQEAPVQQLANCFNMSLPAVSQHLAVLKNVGLVNVKKQGQQRIYQLNPKPLKDVHDWVQTYEKFWNNKLNALGVYLGETR